MASAPLAMPVAGSGDRVKDILGQPFVIKLWKSSFMGKVEKLATTCLVKLLIIAMTLAVITAIVRECGGYG